MSLSDEMTAVLHFDFQESAEVLQNKPISLVQSAFLELTDSQSRVPLHKLGKKECETSILISKARNGCFLAWQLISMGIHRNASYLTVHI
jgi:hypothetical protein